MPQFKKFHLPFTSRKFLRRGAYGFLLNFKKNQSFRQKLFIDGRKMKKNFSKGIKISQKNS